MDTDSILRSSPSFVYEDLLVQILTIQHQMIEGIHHLDRQLIKTNTIRNQLKSRPLTLIDPYGNSISKQYMDHELIRLIVKRFKMNYVPKYLEQWIQFGQLVDNQIMPLNESNLNSSVGHYQSEYPIVTYGEITVWLGDFQDVIPRKIVLKARLTDNMENILSNLKKQTNFTDIEFRRCILNQDAPPTHKNWNEGTILKSEDTVMSKDLHHDHCIIMANTNKDDVKISSSDFFIVVKTLTGHSFCLDVVPSMTIKQVKMKIQDTTGLHFDQLLLKYDGQQLEDETTLADCNIRKGVTMHLIIRLRGGMYHFTSGRQNFHNLPSNVATTVERILVFSLKKGEHPNRLSPIELQNFILEAQDVLLTLLNELKGVYFPQDLPNLKSILASTMTHIEQNDQ